MDTNRLSVLWTKHLSRDDPKRENFETTIRNSTLALGRLSDILDELEAESNTKELSISEYDSPSWAYKQAFLNGQRSAYTRIKSILEVFRRPN